MKVHFYCSSIAGNGYQVGEFGADRHIHPCRTGSPALRYFNMGGLNSVLACDNGQLTLVLRQLGPSNPEKFRKDRTGARIYVNLAFIADVADEHKLRRLLTFCLHNRTRFSDALYSAYQAAAGGELGYDFSFDQVNELIVRIISDPLPPVAPLPEPQGRYNVITRAAACTQLEKCHLTAEDAVFYADTDMTDTEYAMMHGDLPWYVISERTDLRQSGGGTAEPAIWQKLLRRILPDRDGSLPRKRFFLLTGGALGLCLVIVLCCALVSLSPTAPDPLPAVTSSPTAAPTASPTASPAASPTASLAASPTASPAASPTASPAASPTAAPTIAPIPSVYQEATVTATRPDGSTDTMALKIVGDQVVLTDFVSQAAIIDVPEVFTALDARAFANCPNLELLVLSGNIRLLSQTAADWSRVSIRAPEGSYAWRIARQLGILDGQRTDAPGNAPSASAPPEELPVPTAPEPSEPTESAPVS